jgi:outer membrane protein OmpA-like peptidoglycan-associated protein
MRTFIPGFLLFCVYLLFARWYFVCEVRGLCTGSQEEVPTVVETPRANSLVLRSDEGIILQGFDEFLFAKDSIAPVLNENNRTFLAAVADYLEDEPGKQISVGGRYLRSERSSPAGFFDNIGLARAKRIESMLVDLGVAESRIFLNHAEIDADSLLAPLSFRATTPQEGGLQQLRFSFEDMTYSEANFAFKSADFRPRAGFVAYADSVKTYLDENPNYRLVIIGHTDSISSEEFNEELGLQRAESAREYFLELGVENEILAISKGETEPISPNTKSDGSDNPDGRQRNRRVNFRLEPIEND